MATSRTHCFPLRGTAGAVASSAAGEGFDAILCDHATQIILSVKHIPPRLVFLREGRGYVRQ